MIVSPLKNVMSRIKEINDQFKDYYSNIIEINRQFLGKSSLIGGEAKSKIIESGKFKNILVKEAKNLENEIKADSENISNTDDISKVIKNASLKYGVPESLIYSMIKIESNFDPKAVSSAGAQGLMQLMPKTAKYLGVKEVFNPEENIMAGAKYIKELLNHFNGDLKLSLAAYNAGLGRVMKANTIPNIQETRSYVKNVLNSYNNLKF